MQPSEHWVHLRRLETIDCNQLGVKPWPGAASRSVKHTEHCQFELQHTVDSDQRSMEKETGTLEIQIHPNEELARTGCFLSACLCLASCWSLLVSRLNPKHNRYMESYQLLAYRAQILLPSLPLVCLHTQSQASPLHGNSSERGLRSLIHQVRVQSILNQMDRADP